MIINIYIYIIYIYTYFLRAQKSKFRSPLAENISAEDVASCESFGSQPILDPQNSYGILGGSSQLSG